MRAYLVVEGNSDLEFFQRLLPAEIQRETTIVPAGGRSNVTSKARSLMVTKRKPLALVADADAIDKDAVAQRLQELEELVRPTTAGVPCKVFLAVPEIESWLFVVPDALERLSGKKLSSEQIALGKVRPRSFLAELFEANGHWSVAELAGRLTAEELQALRETQPMKGLVDFLTEQVNRKTEPQPV